ncbi:hypothetical protein MRX96_033669 [Rhipicephalus microplus]
MALAFFGGLSRRVLAWQSPRRDQPCGPSTHHGFPNAKEPKTGADSRRLVFRQRISASSPRHPSRQALPSSSEHPDTREQQQQRLPWPIDGRISRHYRCAGGDPTDREATQLRPRRISVRCHRGA